MYYFDSTKITNSSYKKKFIRQILKNKKIGFLINDNGIFINRTINIIRYFNPNLKSIGVDVGVDVDVDVEVDVDVDVDVGVIKFLKELKKRLFGNNDVLLEFNKTNPNKKTTDDFFYSSFVEKEYEKKFYNWLFNVTEIEQYPYPYILNLKTKSVSSNNLELIENSNMFKCLTHRTATILAKKNIKNMMNFVRQVNLKNRLIHVSIKQIDKISDVTSDMSSYLTEGYYNNPQGLWVSCEESWIKSVINTSISPNNWTLSSYIYEIIPGDNICYITNVSELKNFIHKFKQDAKLFDFSNVMNWKKIKRRYNGLIICPYLGDDIWSKNANKMWFQIHGDKKSINRYFEKLIGPNWKSRIEFLAEWYRQWITATGVFWNPRGIKKIILLRKLDL